MFTLSRTLVKTIIWIGLAMVAIVVLHLGGVFALRVGQFAPLTGAFIGGTLALISTCLPTDTSKKTESWIGFEQFSWVLIGFGIIMWGIGESFWRYYVSIGQAPFPSIADVGYSAFPVFHLYRSSALATSKYTHKTFCVADGLPDFNGFSLCALMVSFAWHTRASSRRSEFGQISRLILSHC